MRIVAAVVVGAVLFCTGHAASAAEARRQRSERCIEICNFTFEQCQKDTNSKRSEQCNIDAVRCKNACPFETIEEPAIPTATSHARCLDVCRTTYKKCTQKAANKGGGSCAADDVRCEQACPKPPEAAVAEGAPGAPAGAPGSGVTGSGVAPAAAPVKKPKRGNRIEGAAAPAPISPTPVVAPRERAVQPAPAPEAPAAAPARSEAVAPAAPAPAPAAAAARPEPEKRGFFATLGCFFVACEPAGSTPCLQQCGNAYDECKVRESKRGGECNTRLMNCRKTCSEAAPAN